MNGQHSSPIKIIVRDHYVFNLHKNCDIMPTSICTCICEHELPDILQVVISSSITYAPLCIQSEIIFSFLSNLYLNRHLYLLHSNRVSINKLYLSIIIWIMLFSLFFLHANCIIHKIVSIFSRFENPNANGVMRMINCF